MNQSDKKGVASLFEEIALLLELKGDNPFRIRAYRNAARSLLSTDKDLKTLIQEGSLTDLEGIGKDLAEKITTLVATGRLPFYENLKKKTPQSLLTLSQVRGLGPKKAKILYQKLNIRSLNGLKKACQEGRVAQLKGFGKKTEQNLLEALSQQEIYAKRHLWWEGWEVGEPLLKHLRKIQGVKEAEIAGSLRRGLETVGDLDFLVASSSPKPVMQWFTSHPGVATVLAQGETKATVLLQEGIQADLRVVEPDVFGFALLHSTGSKEHNIKLRERALKKGWSLSEYGLVLHKKKGKLPRLPKHPTEADIYKKAFGLSFIPPELREDRGEFEAAEKGRIPRLIEVGDIRGTFHNHTIASDGKNTLEEMVRAAERKGWQYFGISDHSKSSFQANGLSEERLEEQLSHIKKQNNSKKYKVHIFAGTECDILADGKLDFPNSLLQKLDFVIVSIHSSLSQDEKTTTKRLIRAIEHPLSTMVGHLTGRILLAREPYKVNVEKVIDACIANKKIIELNGNASRLDMDWRFWRAAKEKGLLCCINTDAHQVADLDYIETGVRIGRKGWLEKRDVLNTKSLSEIQAYLKKRESYHL